MTQPLVALRGVTCRFGDVCAVDGLDLDVAQGETVGLIGPNGSGKSTTLGLVAGTLRPTAGTIRLAGADVTRMPAWRRVALGIAWTFQQPRVFERLSVRDNLAAAGRDAADAALHDAALTHRRHALAATLTFAERRRLELARALALRPRVLLVDEPASGLDADELATLRERLAALRARGVAIVLVEHRVGFVAQLAERIVVLEHGRVLAAGTPARVLADPAVCRAYLGDAPAPQPGCAAA
ncbi:ABC transporter ATP-binding protein [Burkholderia ubonensis]|uniref:ABC transporter n=1 Tax=Burkholderia ubonensis TaxID=101571 RepID=A0A107F0I9_9BURK|nr:ATP-binding cassette domain-containing protein [Burkholderia ubonensis]AOK63629.1 ABC transporter [Burkholderia ubonensis]KVS42485.1 ABC transporter [Burkholderia ubonensis]KVS47036.1 ABC transporter [Burkholderia ubonensis]KVS80729.1 ABC transporter [Burkholderia ubonensis]KVS81356.1 ABC transporter [Burkholderia ubonensis]